MPTIKTNNLKIYYELRGSGFPLVLIGGYSGSVEGWDVLVPRVSDLSEHYKVITLDNRGTGRSGAPEGDYPIRTMADDVAALLGSLKMPGAHVLGVSMGGMIAQELAIRHPEKVEGLILICTTPGGFALDAIPGQREVLKKLTWAYAPPQGMTLEDVWIEILKLVYYGKYFEENKARIIAYVPKYQTPLSTFEKHYDAIMKFDACNRLEEIRSKTLVIHGEEDMLVKPESAKILAKRIPNAELKIFEQAGHCVMEEKWEEVKPGILDFLKRQRALT